MLNFEKNLEKSTTDLLTNAYQRVIDWNTVVGKADWTQPKAVENQMSVVHEELITELGGADSSVSFVDAICDSFVVVSNLFYLVSKGASYTPTTMINAKVVDSYSFLTDDAVEQYLTDTDGVRLVLDHICNIIVNYRTFDCIGALYDILDNNDGKFVKKECKDVIDGIMSFYEQSGEDVESVVSGDVVWFRRVSDNKVMKPKPFFYEVDFAHRRVM